MKNLNKIFLIILAGISFLHADLVKEYLNKKYLKICNIKNVYKYEKNEKALSIIGVSCVKSDNLYLIPYIVNSLKHTPYGRKNAIYFLTIFMEKKLLYSYFFDNISLKSFSFPMTDYVLSYIFQALKNGNYKKIKDVIIIKNAQKTYKIYKSKDKMYVDEYINGKLIKRRWYR